MLVGIIGKNVNGWGTEQLRDSLMKRGVSPMIFNFPSLTAHIGFHPLVSADSVDLAGELSALIVRPVGRGSVEEVIFRMDVLHKLERTGVLVVNSAAAIERCVDKYNTLALLEENDVSVPRTVVATKAKEALKGFYELGGDIVLKPLFGSRGIGSTRISDENVAIRIFNALRFYHGVLYLQEFVPHGDSDIRAFVVGDRVAAAMRRVGVHWKTNVSQGAKPVAVHLDNELEDLAIKAASVVDCKVAGVDILECEKGPLIIELNSQPGWRGLQSVTETNIADCIVDYVLSEINRYGE